MFAGVMLLILLSIGGIRIAQQPSQEEPRGDPTLRYENDNLMEYHGKIYREKSNLTTILLMGIDTEGSTKISPYRSGGQAGYALLAIASK